MDELRTLFTNREKAKIMQENGLTVFSCQEILGSMEPVKDFAHFYIKHKLDLQIIDATFLLDYCSGESFTPSEKKAFELGLSLWPKFFETAEQDMDAYVAEAEKINRSKQ